MLLEASNDNDNDNDNDNGNYVIYSRFDLLQLMNC